MTNLVTGLLPIVLPSDWMKISVGSVIGAVQLKDLKDYFGDGNGSNEDTLQTEDITIPDDTTVYKDSPTEQTIQLDITPIGANQKITVKDVSGNDALTSVTYDPKLRQLILIGKTAGVNASVQLDWGTGNKTFTFPVVEYQKLHPNLVLTQVKQDLSNTEYDNDGLQFTSREDGGYGQLTVTGISGFNLSDFTIDYIVKVIAL